MICEYEPLDVGGILLEWKDMATEKLLLLDSSKKQMMVKGTADTDLGTRQR